MDILSTRNEDCPYFCNACHTGIPSNQYRYNCSVCIDYDLCSKCYDIYCEGTDKTPHKQNHRFDRELVWVEKKSIDASTCAERLYNCFVTFAERDCIGVRHKSSNGKFANFYVWYTYQQIGNRIINFTCGLRSIGLQPRDFISIYSNNSLEWFVADYACIYSSFVGVPIHTAFDGPSIEYILNNSSVKCIIASQQFIEHLIPCVGNCKCLKYVVQMEPFLTETEQNQLKTKFQKKSPEIQLYDMTQIEKLGNAWKLKNQPDKQGSLPFPLVKTEPNDLLNVLYTSGSTGFPKGVMITEHFHWVDMGSIYVSPFYAHAADRVSTVRAILNGGKIGVYCGNLDLLFEDMQLIRPTNLSAPPRLWKKLYNDYLQSMEIMKATTPPEKHKSMENDILNKMQDLFGNRVVSIGTGGAPISQTVFKFIKKLHPRVRVSEGYGCTECGDIAGTNGMIYADVKYKIESVPDMGYTTEDQPYPRGELCVKTETMATGYFNNSEESQKAFDEDGYFHTGDVVVEKSKGIIEIIDRKKNIFKLAQGEYIAPDKLEWSLLQASHLIDQILIHGDSKEDYTVAVLIVNVPVFLNHVKESISRELLGEDVANAVNSISQGNSNNNNNNNNITTMLDHLCKNPHIVKAALKELQELCKANQFKSYEIPQGLILDHIPFSVENGMLTPTLKLCRFKIVQTYKTRIEDLYEQIETEKASLERKVLQLLAKNTKLEGNLNSDQLQSISLGELGTDSLSTIRLAKDIQNELQVNVPIEVLMNNNSISSIIDYIKDSKKHPDDMQVEETINWNEECSLADQILNQIQPNSIKTDIKQITNIFLTGATGFLGPYLLKSILEHYSKSVVYCLVRKAGSLKSNLEFYNLWNPELTSRIVELVGDLSKDRFGIAPELYQELAQKIDCIYHCGASVNGIFSYQVQKPANVIGTIEILKLAIASHTKYLHYMSTVSVAQTTNSFFNENALSSSSFADLLPVERIDSHGGYTQSKWVCEKILKKALDKGLPVSIFRPGYIGGDLVYGGINTKDFFSRFLSGCIYMKSFPQVSAPWEMTPVNFMADSIVKLSLDGTSIGQVFNMVELGQVCTVAEIMRSVESFGYKLKAMDYDTWRRDLLSAISSSSQQGSNPLEPLESYFKISFPSNSNNFYTKNYEIALGNHHLQCPKITEQFIHKYLNFMIQKHLIPPPQ